ncbi:MAG: hypothetical protein L0216_06635 [Planctomycetales bacterium]|nr:hypothetical protein [Planctomycetales bacterium]
MTRNHVLAVAALAAAGLGVGLVSATGGGSAGGGRGILPLAHAGGGPTQEAPGVYLTSSPDGEALYRWEGTPSGFYRVTRYDWTNGEAVTRELRVPRPAGAAPERREPEPAKELDVRGIIWTPDAETRTGIVNGRLVKQGEVVTGLSGKKYRVVEIRQDGEVKFEEIPPAGEQPPPK